MAKKAGFRKELVGSTTAALVLLVLKDGPGHGYKIAQVVNERSDGLLKWREGTIYPILHRLEKKGLVESRWQVVDEQKPRRVYELTEQGLGCLQEQKEEWALFSEMMNKLLGVNCSKYSCGDISYCNAGLA